MGTIYINKPYLKRIDTHTRLCCDVLIEKQGKSTLWYEVEKEYEEYLCTEQCDAFFVVMLPYAMYHGLDMQLDSCISERLLYQCRDYLIPALSKYTNAYKNIKVSASQVTTHNFNGKGVGAGVSGGVDSFYTIIKHGENCEFPSTKLTHLTFFNVGSHGDFGGETAREIYEERKAAAKILSEEIGLPMLSVDSNISDVLQLGFEASCSYRTLSVGLALQKLFSVYHFSSGECITMFHIDENEASYHDLLNVQCLSTESLQIYSTGITESRFEKIEYIKDEPIVQKYLNVCISGAYNCGECDKCIRTMNALYALGVLNQYNQTFDLNSYYKKLDEKFGYMLQQKDGKEYVHLNHRETYEYMIKYDIPIPNGAYKHLKYLQAKQRSERVKRVCRYIKNGIKARIKR